eukprot:357046-Prorocentrum_minimum.AAC.3
MNLNKIEDDLPVQFSPVQSLFPQLPHSSSSCSKTKVAVRESHFATESSLCSKIGTLCESVREEAHSIRVNSMVDSHSIIAVDSS